MGRKMKECRKTKTKTMMITMRIRMIKLRIKMMRKRKRKRMMNIANSLQQTTNIQVFHSANNLFTHLLRLNSLLKTFPTIILKILNHSNAENTSNNI